MSLRNCKFKQGTITYHVEYKKSKALVIPNASKDVGQLNSHSLFGQNAKWEALCETAWQFLTELNTFSL